VSLSGAEARYSHSYITGAPVVGGVMTAPPLRKISDNLLQPDDDKNATNRRQNLGKILFDQSSKNKNQK
jgi:hypothetical protein